MKLSAKAISSPARTDKFPPPLMRFLRSNAGSRSRRSRSSPMFVLRKKNNNNAIETTQEPSSPKVTCMGQVRAKRSSKQSSTVKRDRPPTPTRCCRCWWIRKPNPCRCRPVWPKWAFFRRKPTKLKEDSVKSESNFHRDEEERVSVSVDDDDNAFAFAFASASNTPPKNALLLTRCRSAPYRSSSLASRFWSSPLRGEENETQSTCIDNDKSSSNSQRESVSDQEDSVRERFASSIANSEKVETLLKGESEARPVVLTRCKSEPARTGHRLDPEVNSLWKKRRLGFADASYPLHMLSD